MWFNDKLLYKEQWNVRIKMFPIEKIHKQNDLRIS